MEKIKIDLGFAFLVAEPNLDSGYKEICIGLETSNGVWYQDIARIGNTVEEDKDNPGSFVQKFGEIAAYIYGNANSEDYSRKFKIHLYAQPCDAICNKADCIFHCCNNRCNLSTTSYVDNINNEVTECMNYATKPEDITEELRSYVVRHPDTVSEICPECGRKFSSKKVFHNYMGTYIECPECGGSALVKTPEDFCGTCIE